MQTDTPLYHEPSSTLADEMFKPSNTRTPIRHKMRMGRVKKAGRATSGAFGRCKSIPQRQILVDYLNGHARNLRVQLAMTGQASPKTREAIDGVFGEGATAEMIKRLVPKIP